MEDDEEDISTSTDGKDTDVVPDMTQVVSERSRTRTISRSVYTDNQGNPVSQDVIEDINQFQVKLDYYITINASENLGTGW